MFSGEEHPAEIPVHRSFFIVICCENICFFYKISKIYSFQLFHNSINPILEKKLLKHCHSTTEKYKILQAITERLHNQEINNELYWKQYHLPNSWTKWEEWTKQKIVLFLQKYQTLRKFCKKQRDFKLWRSAA